ncbi:MAG: ABC transporter substrate-binding protein [Anaerolineales bacterium]|nr:ABC transporter substrate-binding protein [Anaerolineales bacterium]
MNPAAEPGFPPQRVVSVAPSITDSLLALGLGRYLAGVTDLCLLPDGMEAVARLGRPENIRCADIMGLDPDLILAAGEENSPEQMEEWKRSGLPMWVSSPGTVRRAVADLRDLALMFPSESALQSVVWLDRSVDWLTGSLPEKRVRVFCPRTRRGSADDPQSWEAVGGGSYAGDLLFICGAETVFGSDDSRRYPVVTPGEVMAAAPEVILLAGEPFPFSEADAAAIRLKMPEVPAVKNGRILTVDGRLIFWPGAKMGEAIRMLPALFDQKD